MASSFDTSGSSSVPSPGWHSISSIAITFQVNLGQTSTKYQIPTTTVLVGTSSEFSQRRKTDLRKLSIRVTRMCATMLSVEPTVKSSLELTSVGEKDASADALEIDDSSIRRLGRWNHSRMTQHYSSGIPGEELENWLVMEQMKVITSSFERVLSHQRNFDVRSFQTFEYSEHLDLQKPPKDRDISLQGFSSCSDGSEW